MKKKVSLNGKIAVYLLIFTALMLGVIAVLQTQLLEPMYKSSKISAVKTAAAEIESELGDDEDLLNTMYEVAEEQDVCIRILYSGKDFATGFMGCPLYRMNDRDILWELAKAEANGNEYLNEEVNNKMDSRSVDNIIYTKIVDEDPPKIIMVNASITPVSATIQTLRRQLLIIAGVMILGVLILVYFMNHDIARPLNKINTAAKKLSGGEYEVSEDTNKYLEAYELNETLSQAAADIRKADQAKRDLISNVSHDLRTPLTMITGYGEMMRDLPGEKTDENLQVVIDEAKRLSYLVNDLLDLSRLQEGKIVLQKENFDLSGMISEELRKYDVYKVNEGFEIIEEIEPGLQAYGDIARIRQVLNNFMTNAVNYSGDARKIIVRAHKQDDRVLVEVQDYGEGIEESRLKDIWDRYYKIDKSHVRFSQGSGIGLAIVKEILDLHETTYGVRSKVNEGSVFWFTLPAAK